MGSDPEWDFEQNAAPRVDSLEPTIFGQTPSQTVGPYFHYGLPWRGGADLVGDDPIGTRADLVPDGHFLLNGPTAKRGIAGQRIELVGVVLDGDDRPVPDSMVEIWQANASGRYASAGDDRTELPLDNDFTGFGRCATSPHGVYRFLTVKPGRVPGPGNTLQAPHRGQRLRARHAQPGDNARLFRRRAGGERPGSDSRACACGPARHPDGPQG